MQRTLLALALIATSGVSYAQTMSTSIDANGQPIVGRNDWVRQRGDQPGPNGTPNIATAPSYTSGSSMTDNSQMGVPLQRGGTLARGHAVGPEPMPSDRGPHQVAFRDEYGFRYDADGNRLDARGYVVSPHRPSR